MEWILYRRWLFINTFLASIDPILKEIMNRYLSKDMDEVTNVHLDIMMNGWNDLTVRYYRCAFHEKEKLPEFFSIERKNHLTNLENLYIRYGVYFM